MTEKYTHGKLLLTLVDSGKYKEAVEDLNEKLRKHPKDDLLYRERAHLHLYFGHVQQARADFDTVARLDAAAFRTPPGRLESDSEYNAIGLTYWIEGHKELAIAFWQYTTDLLCNGRVSQSHYGGGIESGLLLWFGAVHRPCQDDIALVRTFFQKRLASKYWDVTSWPFPAAQFFLGSIGEDDLLNSAEDAPALCEAHFAVAIQARAARRHAAYRKHLQLAVSGKSPSCFYDFYNVWPYFLARHEVGS